MQLHELKPKHKNKDKKRVGRGGKKGTTSGKGTKGQSSRAGRKMVPIIRELIKRYPKLRGYKFRRFKEKFAIVNIGTLEKTFKEGDHISPKILLEKRLIRKIKGKTPKVKILGKGELTKKLAFSNCQISKPAKEKIEKTGGLIKPNINKI